MSSQRTNETGYRHLRALGLVFVGEGRCLAVDRRRPSSRVAKHLLAQEASAAWTAGRWSEKKACNEREPAPPAP